MPIAPKYTWWETPEEVCIRLEGAPIKDQSQVFCSDAVVKVNAAPYFLLLDLHGEVDEDRSAAALHGGSTVLKLQKRAAGMMWGRLTAQGEKAALQQRRVASIQRAHAKAEVVRQERQARKQRESKEASERQIALERRKRSEIEARKAQELQQERSQLSSWQHSLAAGEQQQQGQQELVSGQKRPTNGQELPDGGWRLGAGMQVGEGDESDYEDEEEGDADQATAARDQGAAASSGTQQQKQQQAASAGDHEHYYGRGWRPGEGTGRAAAAAAGRHSTGSAALSAGSSDSDQSDPEGESEEGEESGEEEEAAWDDAEAGQQVANGTEQAAAVPVRAALAAVKVSFTPTESPYLPARETREDEIREYKRNNGPTAQQALQDSADVSDRQPAFLKDKGDALYAQNNYRGAINAYSRALQLDESLPAIWANRAACHLQIGAHDHCIGDCDMALALLRPRLEAVEKGLVTDDGGKLRRQFVKVLARRAAARAAGGQMQGAAEDLQEALRYEPSNAALAADLSEVLASSAPADAPTLRTRGDTRFKAGDHAGAAQAYTLLLALPAGPLGASESDRLAALANRAACWLPLQRYRECVADCGEALEGNVALAAADMAAAVPEETAAGDNGAVAAELEAASDEPCQATSEEATTAQARTEQGAADSDAASASGESGKGEGAPEAWLAAHAADLQAAGCGARLASAARLLARRAAAHSYLKQYDAAAGDYGLAQWLYGVLGDGGRREQLGRDLQGVLQLQQQGQGQQQHEKQ